MGAGTGCLDVGDVTATVLCVRYQEMRRGMSMGPRIGPRVKRRVLSLDDWVS